MSESEVFPSDLRGKKIHFVGIKGTGMAALAEVCVGRGAVVSGSDVADVFYTDAILAKIGVVPSLFSAKNINGGIDLVVHSAAYLRSEHEELLAAEKLGIPIVLYAEALGAISRRAKSVAVCGVHGKTSTTGIIGTLFKELNLPAQILAGSAISSFGGKCAITLGQEIFVAETCEYKRHFMQFSPKKIVLTAVESDHQDFYPTYESIRDAFVDFVCTLPKGGSLIFCADDKGACETAEIVKKMRGDIRFVEYGERAHDFRLVRKDVSGGAQHFLINGEPFCLKVPGEHNAKNSAAAVALACDFARDKGETVDFDAARRGLENFCGAKRRSEVLGEVAGILFLDDYGHTPTEIKSTLAGFREFYKGRRLVVDFMSHTYTRTLALLGDFARAFPSADFVVLQKIYGSAREGADFGEKNHISGKILAEKVAEHHKNVKYFDEFEQSIEFLKGFLQSGDIFVTMGAGDNWKIGEALLRYFSNR